MEFTEKETQFLSEIESQTTKMVDARLKGVLTEEKFNEGLTQIKEQNKGNTEAFKITVEAQNKVIDTLGKKISDFEANKSLFTSNLPQFEQVYKDNQDAFKAMSQTGRGSIQFDLNVGVNKASADMSLANLSGGTASISTMDNQVGMFLKRNPYLRELINTSTTDSQYITWVDQANPDGTTGSTAEGGAKNKIDFDLVERKLPVECINAYVTVSKQALADFGQMRALINEELRTEVELNLDGQILTGSGTTPALKGIQTYATAYVNTGFALLVYNPSELDVLNIMSAQIATAKGRANVALMNPIDVAKLRSLRRPTTGVSGDLNWVLQYDAATGLMRYGSIYIVENVGVTANTMYVLDSKACRLAIREDFNITVGLDGNNFTKNQVTILGEMRAAHYVKQNDAAKMVYCSSISGAITGILHP